jgi:phenylacetate-CoA ligase
LFKSGVATEFDRIRRQSIEQDKWGKNSMMSALVRSVFFPLWMIKDGDRELLSYLGRFDDIDGMSRDALKQRQETRLRELLVHAYGNTTYYRNLFDRIGFRPENAKSADMSALPLLTKDIVKSQYERLTAGNFAQHQLVSARTGGSTGVPMTFIRDKHCLYQRKAQELYFDRWMGYSIGDKAALFVAASHFDNVADKWKANLRNATCERLLRFDPHHITDAYMSGFSEEYASFRPAMIKCFPNSLGLFADYLRRQDREVPKVKAISCTGENLYEQQRRLFEGVFGGKVFEKYGTRESGVIACECREHRGLHLFTDGAYVEVIDENGHAAEPGSMGRLVITDLFNYGMPMIRYEIGDMAIASDRVCACGSPLPLVEKILGRDRDILYDSEGNPKPGYLFVEAINSVDLAAQLQVIQTERNQLLVKVAADSRSGLDVSDLHDKFQEILGPGVTITFEFVDAIARDPSGKYRYVMSLVPKTGDAQARRNDPASGGAPN